MNAYRWLVSPYRLLDDMAQREGLTFRLRLPLLGECLITGDPRTVAAVQGHPALEAGSGIAALRAVLGDRSLITLDGAAHLERKRLIAPPLRDGRIEQYDGVARRVALAELDAIAVGRELSVYELARRIGLRTIIHVIFGALPAAREALLAELVSRFVTSFSNPLVLYLKPLQVDLGPLSPWGRALRNRRRLERAIESEIDDRRRSGATGDDVISHIVRETRDGRDDDVVTEILTLLIFGHDTGAATLAWALEHLYRSREPLARATEEARSLAAQDPATATRRSRYVVACLKESMRLAPVVVHVTRVATTSFELDGHLLAAGDRVLPSAYVAHRNAAVFPEPSRFRPERFLRQASYPHAYFPFGLGVRTCVGEPLVMRVMLQIVSVLLAHAELELVSAVPARPVRHLALIVPERGTRMRRIG